MLPYNLPVNEDFPSGWTDDYTPYTNWPRGQAVGRMTNNNVSFGDQYTGASSIAIPIPTGPCQPQFCNVKVNHAFQEYRAGSLTPGQGFRIQTNTAQFFLDHAEALNIVSPAP